MPFYILNADHSVRRVGAREWGEWFERNDRTVARNFFGHEGIGEIMVSTVFLGVDHNFFGDGPPVVFETMIFGGGDGMDQWQRRSCTWEEALRMHAHAVDLVKNAFNELAKASGA